MAPALGGQDMPAMGREVPGVGSPGGVHTWLSIR
jgi:hypothetical protein